MINQKRANHVVDRTTSRPLCKVPAKAVSVQASTTAGGHVGSPGAVPFACLPLGVAVDVVDVGQLSSCSHSLAKDRPRSLVLYFEVGCQRQSQAAR